MKKLFLISLCIFATTGCTTIAKTSTTAASTAVGAVAAGPVGAVVGAVVGDLAGEIIVEPILEFNKKKVVVEQKVDSIWGLLARLGEQAAWLIGAIILLPMLIPLLVGYIIPSPREKRRK
jgi:hypothetical protein